MLWLCRIGLHMWRYSGFQWAKCARCGESRPFPKWLGRA